MHQVVLLLRGIALCCGVLRCVALYCVVSQERGGISIIEWHGEGKGEAAAKERGVRITREYTTVVGSGMVGLSGSDKEKTRQGVWVLKPSEC